MTNPSDKGTAGSALSLPAVPAVHLRNITKTFGDVRACDDITLEVERGQIHGLLGENGAGKSTLMKILIGLTLPDSGSIEIDGNRVVIDSPQAASQHGIGMVHQHFSLVEPLRVWENVVLGSNERLNARGGRSLVREIGERYGIRVDPDARVADLSAGLRQRVEIIKCLRRDPDIVIFDEPTSVLTPQESEQLFEVLRAAVLGENKAVVLVSHKLDEILSATDRVTILRKGAVADAMETASADARSLAQAMVGRPVSLREEAGALGLATEANASEPSRRPGEAALVLKGLSTRRRDGSVGLDGLDLDVHAGEIVGVAGVEGNGQTDLGDVLASLLTVSGGTVDVLGARVGTGVAGGMRAAGVALIPEDRHDAGCVLDMSVAENLHLGSLCDGRAFQRYDTESLRQRSEELIAEYGIQTSGPEAPFRSLSGGNQQRVVVARELSSNPRVLVASQPTRGLDVGAIEFMSERLRTAADDGAAVLLISSELEELLHLADHIVVMYRGSIVGSMPRADASLERIGLLMGGTRA